MRSQESEVVNLRGWEDWEEAECLDCGNIMSMDLSVFLSNQDKNI